MIDLQYLSIILGALSFWIAAVYYVLNLREISRNRRITLTTTVLEPFMTKEGYGDLLDLLVMEWTDFEDFKSKYDHKTDPENARMRLATWNRFETIGMLCKEGLLDVNTIYYVVGGVLQVLWFKFKPVIEMYRETEYDKEAYSNFEYLAEKVFEYTQSRKSTGELVRRAIKKAETAK